MRSVGPFGMSDGLRLRTSFSYDQIMDFPEFICFAFFMMISFMRFHEHFLRLCLLTYYLLQGGQCGYTT